ncbi:unnamed protein product [Lupinus luteus]|uniref:non-specific serine/threonine protein kinase n=1 Tax=Lupinus luteus TaxID=3873 RepID=A0AAV1YFI4_LUPLU
MINKFIIFNSQNHLTVTPNCGLCATAAILSFGGGTWHGHLYIIDVSQVVDLDHPHALDFLREDCVHVSNGVVVMTITELLDFIVNASIADDIVDSYLEEVFVF